MKSANYQNHALDFQIQSITLDMALEKYASVVKYTFAEDAGVGSSIESVFSGLGSSVIDFVKSHIDTSSIVGFLGSLADIIVPGMLWSSHPVLASIVSIAEEMGYPIHSILEKIFEYIKDTFTKGSTPSVDTALSMIPKFSTSNQDFFQLIRYSCADGTIVKNAAMFSLVKESNQIKTAQLSWIGNFLRSILFLNKPKDQRGLGDNKKSGFSFGSLLGWLLKGILVTAFASWATKSLGVNDHKAPPSAATSETPSVTPATTQVATTPAQKPANLMASGWGEKLHNMGDKIWLIEVPDGMTTEQMLLQWIHKVYGNQLSNKEGKILNSQSFRLVVSALESDERSNQDYLYIPQAFKSARQIVDTALNDIFK